MSSIDIDDLDFEELKIYVREIELAREENESNIEILKEKVRAGNMVKDDIKADHSEDNTDKEQRERSTMLLAIKSLLEKVTIKDDNSNKVLKSDIRMEIKIPKYTEGPKYCSFKRELQRQVQMYAALHLKNCDAEQIWGFAKVFKFKDQRIQIPNHIYLFLQELFNRAFDDQEIQNINGLSRSRSVLEYLDHINRDKANEAVAMVVHQLRSIDLLSEHRRHKDVVQAICRELHEITWAETSEYDWRHEASIIYFVFHKIPTYKYKISTIASNNIKNWTEETYMTAIEDLMNWLESNQIQPTVRTTYHTPTPTPAPTLEMNEVEVHRKISTGQRERVRDTRPKRRINHDETACFNCGEKGHPFYRCPRPLSDENRDKFSKQAIELRQQTFIRMMERNKIRKQNNVDLHHKSEQQRRSQVEANTVHVEQNHIPIIEQLEVTTHVGIHDRDDEGLPPLRISEVVAWYDTQADAGRQPFADGVKNIRVVHVKNNTGRGVRTMTMGDVDFLIDAHHPNLPPQKVAISCPMIIDETNPETLIPQGHVESCLSHHSTRVITKTDERWTYDNVMDNGYAFTTFKDRTLDGPRIDRYQIRVTRVIPTAEVLAVEVSHHDGLPRINYLHRMFGHQGTMAMGRILDAHFPEYAVVFKEHGKTILDDCRGCAYNNKTKPASTVRGQHPWEVIHLDYHKLSTPTPCGHKYVLVFQDSVLPKAVFVRLTRTRANTADEMIIFANHIKTKYGGTITSFFGDKEFCHRNLKARLATANIAVQGTDGRNPRANLAENAIYRLQRLGGAFGFDMHIHDSLTGFLYLAAAQVLRVTPDDNGTIADIALGMDHTQVKLPYGIPGQELAVNVSPTFRKANLPHVEFPHAVKGIWLCHNEDTGGEMCMLWNVPSTRCIQTFRRRAITLFNTPIHPGPNTSPSTILSLPWYDNVPPMNPGEGEHDHEQAHQIQVDSDDPRGAANAHTVHVAPDFDVNDTHSEIADATVESDEEEESQQDGTGIVTESRTNDMAMHNMNRQGHPRYRYILPRPTDDTPMHGYITTTKELFEISAIDRELEENPITQTQVPRSLPEAIRKGGDWKEAAWKEWDGFLKDDRVRILSQTEYIELKDQSPDSDMLDLGMITWRFRSKADGTKKGRMCFRGDIYRKLHPELVGTFASATAGRETMRMVFAIAAQLGLVIDLLDIKQAFLGVWRKEACQAPIYAKVQIPDERQGWKTAIIEILCNIYGDTTAQGAFQDVLTGLMKEKYMSSTHDVCLFRGSPEADRTIFCTVVDDILRVYDEEHGDPEYLTRSIEKRFQIKVDKTGERFCGVTFKRCHEGIFLYQHDIIMRALARIGWNTSNDPPKAKATPMCESLHQPLCDKRPTPEGVCELDTEDKETYQAVLGVLMFLDYTRIDCTYAIRQLSRHAHRPSNEALKAMGRVLRYLWGTRDWGILYRTGTRDTLQLSVYCDASHATQVDSSSTKSQTGIIVTLNGTPIAWRSQKQGLTCASSTESEVVALSEAVLLARAILPILEFIRATANPSLSLPPVLFYVDNTSSINLTTERLGATARTRHFAIRQAIVREFFASKRGMLGHIDGDINPSDCMTKPLTAVPFQRHRAAVMTQLTKVSAIAK